MKDRETYPGEVLRSLQEQLLGRIPERCRTCQFPQSLLSHSIRLIYEAGNKAAKTKEQGFRNALSSCALTSQLVQKVDEAFDGVEDSCPGPKTGYFADHGSLPRSTEQVCQFVMAQSEMNHIIATSQDLLDTDAYA